MITKLETTFGREARERLADSTAAGPAGARAALETFYYAFNQRSLEVFREVWLDDPLVQLNNPLGGILRGGVQITALYDRVFNGSARVWVEFHDIVEYASPEAVVFAGRERGEYSGDGRIVPLEIRTSRVFRYSSIASGWRQVHHHGSIDDLDLLRRYRDAVGVAQPATRGFDDAVSKPPAT